MTCGSSWATASRPSQSDALGSEAQLGMRCGQGRLPEHKEVGMRVTWRRRLLVTVGSGVVFCSGFGLAVASAPPPTLSGEALNGTGGTGFSLCPSPTFTVSGTIPTFNVSGDGTSTTANPYPGSFSETGNWTSTSFSA